MHRADDEGQSLLKYQLNPAVVLDASGTVTAINEGGLRLICDSSFSNNNNPNPCIGRKISDLNVAISPDSSPALWTWSEILTAAAKGNTGLNSDVSALERNDFQTTDDFWNQEAIHQLSIESSVYVIKTRLNSSASGASGGAEGSSKIKARVNVRWYPPGIFLVMFGRPSVLQPPRKKLPLVPKASQSLDDMCLLPARCSSCANLVLPFGSESDSKDHMLSASQITSSLIPYITATLDAEGQVVQMSDSWYRFTGLGKEESLGSGWISVIHPDDVTTMTSAWVDILRNERPNWTHEARYREASTGEYCWFLIRAQVYKDVSGQVVCWYASMMDINDGVIARQEADRRRRSMLTLISRTDILLWGVDRSNQLYIREGGLNWEPPEFPRSPQSTTHQESTKVDQDSGESDHCKHKELVSVVQTILLGHEFDSVVEHTEAERHFRTIFVAERTACGTACGTATDGDCIVEAALALTFETTDQIAQATLRLENERLALNEKSASEASAMKSRFLANMSHEIRTPISGIIGLSELLYDSLISKEQTELVLDVRTSAQFLLALVNDILDLSKIDSGQLNIECIPFSPREMIRDTLVPLQFQAKEKGLDLRWTYDVGPPTTFLGDPHRIRQVLTNLIGNCIKFTPKGFVDLNVSVAHHVDGEILDVKFVVQDTGIGIAEEARALLFKPFSQADSSTARMYGGTGLGLSICLELVELMGGHMSLQSTLGKGTTVTFNVPFKFHHTPSSEIRPSLLSNSQNQLGETSELITTVYRVRRTSVQKAPCKGEDSQGLDSEILVLIVDDNVINLKVNSHLIERSGYKVATACNGQEAWEYLCKTSTQPRPDMVFMDCMMPVVDGFEATRRIRHDADMFDEQIRTLPIVALTASALHSDKEKCWEVGMDDYIGRPVSRNALKDAVVRWTSTKNA